MRHARAEGKPRDRPSPWLSVKWFKALEPTVFSAIPHWKLLLRLIVSISVGDVATRAGQAEKLS